MLLLAAAAAASPYAELGASHLARWDGNSGLSGPTLRGGWAVGRHELGVAAALHARPALGEPEERLASVGAEWRYVRVFGEEEAFAPLLSAGLRAGVAWAEERHGDVRGGTLLPWGDASALAGARLRVSPHVVVRAQAGVTVDPLSVGPCLAVGVGGAH